MKNLISKIAALTKRGYRVELTDGPGSESIAVALTIHFDRRIFSKSRAISFLDFEQAAVGEEYLFIDALCSCEAEIERAMRQ